MYVVEAADWNQVSETHDLAGQSLSAVGDLDQFALMRTYREVGLDVPVRGDHVPEMEGDRLLTPEGTPGYFTLGRLFANGYLKALLRGTGNG